MDHLVFTHEAVCYNEYEYSEGHTGTMFMFNLVGRELDIVIGMPDDAAYYYIDDRLEFYYDDDMNLIYIKITHLTDEEYEHFRYFVRPM